MRSSLWSTPSFMLLLTTITSQGMRQIAAQKAAMNEQQAARKAKALSLGKDGYVMLGSRAVPEAVLKGRSLRMLNQPQPVAARNTFQRSTSMGAGGLINSSSESSGGDSGGGGSSGGAGLQRSGTLGCRPGLPSQDRTGAISAFNATSTSVEEATPPPSPHAALLQTSASARLLAGLQKDALVLGSKPDRLEELLASWGLPADNCKAKPPAEYTVLITDWRGKAAEDRCV